MKKIWYTISYKLDILKNMEQPHPSLEASPTNSQLANFSVLNGHMPEQRAAASLPSQSEWHDALENGPVPPMAGPAEELAEPEWHDAFEGWSDWLLEWFQDMVS